MDSAPKKISFKIYAIISMVFLIWLAFFDRSNWWDVWRMKKKYNHLIENRDYYKKEAIKATEQNKELFGNMDSLEKFAREKYLMKKENEDVFIMEKKAE